MSKLLPTRLPLAQGQTVSGDTFNRLVRVLEINLGAFDPSFSAHYSTAERDAHEFRAGSVIFNTTASAHQGYDGSQWLSLYDELTWIDYVTGFSAIPTLLTTIADGDVYEYTYSNGTLYRLVPSGSAVDSFYTTFSGGVLSGLVAEKQQRI